MADIKPVIKQDPDAPGASPAAFEDDIYEDAGDLEFNQNGNYNTAYLARIPRYLWDAWDHLDEDAEIQIGTIRIEVIKKPDGSQDQEMSMLLNSDLSQHQLVPKEYNLDIASNDVTNTFVFTEQDLPGFKSRAQIPFDMATANMPSRLSRPANDKPTQKPPADPNRRFQPYYKKAIPKRTTLAARIRHEVACIPVDNAESQSLMALRTAEAMKPRVQTKFISEDTTITGGGFIHAGTIGANASFGGFIRTKNQNNAQKAQLQKTTRMPPNELLDRLFACFRRYKYWSMKAFRAELQQPEAYLRENLEIIAVLAKSGPFATQWSLKPESIPENYVVSEEGAPTGADGGEDSDMADVDDDDEDPDMKFEDVA